MRILTATQMNEVDRLTTEQYGISQIQLMENAARRVLEILDERYGPIKNKLIAIVCGKGNNGGDGLELARQLQAMGANPQVCLVASPADLSGLARVNSDLLRDLCALQEIHSESDWDDLQPVLKNSVCVVDAILGTGVIRPLEGLLLYVVQSMNSLDVPIISMDIPSGIFSDDIATETPCVRADITATFTAPKVGMILGRNADAVGELIIASIGTPPELLEKSGSRLSLSTEELLVPFRRPRPPYSHKGDFGKILIVAGSRGKLGAAILAGTAALRAGAGAVTLAVPAHLQDDLMAAAPPELMTEGLVDAGKGNLDSTAGKQILLMLKDFDTLAIGPGLGTTSGAVAAILEVVERSPIPIVADADALNALAQKKSLWKSRAPLILTPHMGEMARLLKKSTERVFADRIELAARFAKERECHVVLKGFRSLVCDPDGEIWVNITGNPGMATAGSGDVLTGITASFVARSTTQKSVSVHNAVAAAVYLHGAAGDAARDELGEHSLTAGDIIRYLPKILNCRARLHEAANGPV
ncbi:MAG TPA: NAD(P)H-hydrate dehydratase [Acidobacteriota bacterium]|jgi:NAD(P)H-hydrate epimerase